VSRLLVRGARVVDARRPHEGELLDVLVEGNTIAAVGPAASIAAAEGDEVIDGRGRALIPGLVNTHTHAAMVLFRGYTDDVPLMEWLEQKIWPVERHLEAEHVYQGTRLACLEMLASGTTTFHDMYFFAAAAARAVEETGIRAALSQVLFELPAPKGEAALKEEIEGGLARLRGRRAITLSVGPHAPYTVSLAGLATVRAIADRAGALVHFHLAETERELAAFRERHGAGLVESLDRIGFLGPRLIAAHGIWLEGSDLDTLAARGVTISHCPTSNLKLGSGWSPAGPRLLPYPALRRAGVRVTLGTDGAASNNNLDMFEAMKLAALLQKHATGDPTCLPAREAFAMATVEGAEALGLHAGLIAPGRLADLVLLDLDRPYFAPGHDLIADLVYAAKADCVDTVIVDGRVVLRQGRRPDQPAIMAEARAAALDLFGRAAPPS
jgi:5-methylthioadenosine/S-adenosylhomocysteine deaminase